ncbi:Outer membrane protein SusF domain-containing protein [Bacteroides sp.]|uniref:Outer membrane protein SusF domain-containing protein n=1 Tax=Bacteroides sp. TaxID=29523 RepID=UPI0025B7A873|nr:DUF5115 domain-containing protein [Bacteroides sp.]
MKKLSIYITMLLAASLTACNEDFNEGVASPQSYGQEEAAGKITFAATGVDPINLGNVSEESVVVAVFTAPVVQEETTFSYKMKLDNKVTLDVNSEGYVTTENLQDAVGQIYGIRPVERTMKAVLIAYVTSGKSVYAVPAEEFELKVTPKAPEIESAYYINGSLTWEQNVAFSNTSGDPYANSVFTTTVPAVITDNTGAEDAYFLIKSNSGKSLGVADADNDALEGNLVLSEAAKPIKISGGDYKSVKISINMMEGTYKIEKITDAPYLWIPGNHQGWAPSQAPTLFNPEGNKAHWGMSELNGGFKFTAQPYWPNNSNGGVDYGYDYFTSKEGIANDGGNLSLPQGIYYMIVNLDDKYVSATEITSMDIIGTAVGGWENGKELTYDATEKCWTLNTEMTAGDFKLRVNSTWDPNISFGGTLDAPTPFSNDNIVMDASGNYTIKFYLSSRLVLIKE